MENPVALNHLSENTVFRKGDVFVLFGELFGRGYATGLLDEARKAGMDIVGMTVGRRDENNFLRPLNAEELSAAESRLGGRIINIPLMAGFDLDAPEGGPTPTDLLAAMTLENWQQEKLDGDYVSQCRAIATKRFTTPLFEVMAILDGMIVGGRNVFFAHTMAGGIPKAKIFLVVANRIYKGRGSRHISSQALLDSDMGKLILRISMTSPQTPTDTSSTLVRPSVSVSRHQVGRSGIRPTATTDRQFSSTGAIAGRPTRIIPRATPRWRLSVSRRMRGPRV